MTTLAMIGLGSNLGDRRAHLEYATAALAETPGIVVLAVSSYHQTAPVGGPGGQGAFLNAAAALETSLAPIELLRRLQTIETAQGNSGSTLGRTDLNRPVVHGSGSSVRPQPLDPALIPYVATPLAAVSPIRPCTPGRDRPGRDRPPHRSNGCRPRGQSRSSTQVHRYRGLSAPSCALPRRRLGRLGRD